MMTVVAKCRKCDAGLPVNATDPVALIKCGRCGTDVRLDVSDEVRRDSSVDRCPVCSGTDFYIRKDFDPKIGLTVCYRCHTEFRGGYKRTAGSFDLHTADVLEQEYERRIGRR